MRTAHYLIVLAIGACWIGLAHSTPPLPVRPQITGVCTRTAGADAPARHGLEYVGAVGARSVWATPGAFACSEPAFGANVDCFAGPGTVLVRVESKDEVVGYDLGARESIRIAPEGVSCAAPPDGPPPTEVIAHEPAPDMNDVHAAIAAEAQRLYGGECGRVVVPERAIIPVELTGGGHAEYAVLFSRVQCANDGGSTTRWQGTGGPMIQFWLASGGPQRMLLEHSMMGFSPADDFAGLISHQHGGFCLDGAGPNICEVVYRWNDRDQALEVVQRTPLQDSSEIERRTRALRFAYDEVSRW